MKGYIPGEGLRRLGCNIYVPGAGIAKLAEVHKNSASEVENRIKNTPNFAALVEDLREQFKIKRQPEIMRKGRNIGASVGGIGGGGLGGIALGLATRRPGAVLAGMGGGGLVGSIGGAESGKRIGKRMFENWDVQHGSQFAADKLKKELRETLIKEMKRKAIMDSL